MVLQQYDFLHYNLFPSGIVFNHDDVYAVCSCGVELTDRSADVRHAVRCRRVGEAAPHTARPHSLAAPRPVRRRQERVQLPVRLLRHLACSTTKTIQHYHRSHDIQAYFVYFVCEVIIMFVCPKRFFKKAFIASTV